MKKGTIELTEKDIENIATGLINIMDEKLKEFDEIYKTYEKNHQNTIRKEKNEN